MRPETLEDRLLKRVGRKRGDVFVRADFEDLGGYDQVGRVLHKIVREGRLVRVGQGLYARASRSITSGEPTGAGARDAAGSAWPGRDRDGADAPRARLQRRRDHAGADRPRGRRDAPGPAQARVWRLQPEFRACRTGASLRRLPPLSAHVRASSKSTDMWCARSASSRKSTPSA